MLGLHWRAIFYVNVPIGLVTFGGAALLVPESKPTRALRLDLPGAGLISLVSFALMYPLIQGRDARWPAWMVALLVAAVPLLVLFCYAQRWRDQRDGSALVPAELLGNRFFATGLLMLLVLFTGLASLFLVLSYDLQPGLGWSPVKAALSWLGWPIGITLASGIAQRFGARYGLRLIQAGLAVMTAGILLLIALMTGAGTALSWWQVVVPTLVMGLGMGLCVPILTNVVLAGVPQHSAGAGSGVTNAILQLGAAAGIAVVGMIFFGLTASGAAAAADSAAPQLRQKLAAAGVPAARQQQMTRAFRRCFQMQEQAIRTSTAVLPGCQAADSRAEAAIQKATSMARADNSAAATSTTLWYNAGALVLANALTLLLRPARQAGQEPPPETR